MQITHNVSDYYNKSKQKTGIWFVLLWWETGFQNGRQLSYGLKSKTIIPGVEIVTKTWMKYPQSVG